MKLEKRKPSGREKDQASIKLLEKLREQLYSSNTSAIRQSAFSLSWMQDDGVEILKEALFSNAARKTKSAAAYGLRKMQGRMKKIALEALSEGLKHSDSTTVEVCENALLILKKNKTQAKLPSKGKTKTHKFEIRQIPEKRRQKQRSQKVVRQRNRYPKK